MSLLTLLACSLAGQWDATGEDPTKADDSAVDSDSNDLVSTPALMITELMKDPDAVSDDVGEWFEVVNLGSDPVDLNGLTVDMDGGDGFVVDATLNLAAGGRAVFAPSADAATNGGVPVDFAYSVDDLKLSNEGGTLSLLWNDAAIDSVSWDTLPDEKGHAISLDPGANDPAANDLPANWCAAATPYGAGDFGTPGAANPVCTDAPPDRDGDGVADADDCEPDDADVYAGAKETADGKDNDCDGWVDERAPTAGELVVTEIMDDPDPTDDADGEWFEIVNVARVPLELSGIEITDHSGESFTLETDAVLEPDGLWLLAVSDDPDKNDGLTPDYVFDHDAFHLENDKDEVVLSLAGTLLDEVAYDSDFPHEKGKSRSVDPIGASATRNDDPDYWCEGDGDYGPAGNQGTPGAVNDACK